MKWKESFFVRQVSTRQDTHLVAHETEDRTPSRLSLPLFFVTGKLLSLFVSRSSRTFSLCQLVLVGVCLDGGKVKLLSNSLSLLVVSKRLLFGASRTSRLV